MDQLNALLQSLPGYALLTDAMKQAALDGARVPDGLGVWPGEEGYQPTYDIFFAAASLIGFLQAQPFVKAAGSEGTTVSVERPDWAGLLAYYRSQSPIVTGAGSGVLGVLPIPGPAGHVRRTDMSGRDAWGRLDPHYGDVNTDAH